MTIPEYHRPGYMTTPIFEPGRDPGEVFAMVGGIWLIASLIWWFTD